MSTKELLDRWSANNDRPRWIQKNRKELTEATGVDIPYRLHKIDAWLGNPSNKAAVTRKLRELIADAEAETATTDTDTDADQTEDQTDG